MTTLTKTPRVVDITSDWVTRFSEDRKEPKWLLDLRLEAFKQYIDLPYPDNKNNRWKRTGLKEVPWDQLEFNPSESKVVSPFVSLDEAIKKNSDPIKSAWQKGIKKAAGNKFHSLTMALGNGGLCLFVPKNTQLKTPLHQLTSGNKPKSAQFPLHFIFVGENAEAQIWEDVVGDSKNESDLSFTGSFTSINLSENSQTNYYYLQHWGEKKIHFQFQDITQSKQTRFNAVAISLGGQIFHNESTIDLIGEGAENKILGVLFGDKNQNFENWITQNHLAPKTTSDIQYRGALKDTSKSFFSGMVSIIKQAQQSDAYQSAKTLLLSEGARADAIPNLEILADDVKCSHGAAVGPVDPDQKYYLQTRGIDSETAEEIIIQGFVEPVIAAVPNEAVQEQLRTFIQKKMGK